jgi:hypothetical protein
MQLQPSRIGGEAVTGQASDHVPALLDVLLSCTALVVEHRHPFGQMGHIGRDEPDARIKLAGMSLDLGHHSLGLCL